MIRLGLRLAVSGGREALIRLVILASAVGIGVGLLLTAIAGVNAVSAQNARYAWLDTGVPAAPGAVILTSLTIAGCTLAVAMAAGLAERKRPFSLLRLTGARLGMLRRVIVLESAVPLLAVAAIAIGAGFGAAAMFSAAEMQRPLAGPGAAYYVMTAAGIGLALGLILATFPLLRRITGPETARTD